MSVITLNVNGLHSPVNKWISNIYCSSCLSFNGTACTDEVKRQEDSPQKGKLSSGAETRIRQREPTKVKRIRLPRGCHSCTPPARHLSIRSKSKDLQEVDGLRYSSGWELELVAHACPAPRTQRQDDHAFQASRGCNGILSQNSNTNKRNTTIVRDFQILFSISDRLSRQNQQRNSGLHTLAKWTQYIIQHILCQTKTSVAIEED